MEQSNASGSSAADSDQEFDPSADMLVNDFDDGHTLDEEEALGDNGNVADEIDDLQREGEMPLEELLALYQYGASGSGCRQPDAPTSTTGSGDEQQPSTSHQADVDEQRADNVEQQVDDLDSIQLPSSLLDRWPLVEGSSPDPLGGLIGSIASTDGDDDDEEFDGEDVEDESSEDWRRQIQVGIEYQAEVPEDLQQYDGAPPYENEDTLIWNPYALPEDVVMTFLRRFRSLKPSGKGTTHDVNQLKSTPLPETSSPGRRVRDDERALYLLLQVNHDVDEALRRKLLDQVPQYEVLGAPKTAWSELECTNFEDGLKLHGKDFFTIQRTKVLTRTVGELVHFYYLWKKTERHDAFASGFRVEKKKYMLNPGTTDYMDRYIEEQENQATMAQSLSQSSTSSSGSNKPGSTQNTLSLIHSLVPPYDQFNIKVSESSEESQVSSQPSSTSSSSRQQTSQEAEVNDESEQLQLPGSAAQPQQQDSDNQNGAAAVVDTHQDDTNQVEAARVGEISSNEESSSSNQVPNSNSANGSSQNNNTSSDPDSNSSNNVTSSMDLDL